jgi:hypothetical protein
MATKAQSKTVSNNESLCFGVLVAKMLNAQNQDNFKYGFNPN